MAKKKLKTMNEISAAEAVKLFDAAMGLALKHDPYNIGWLIPNPPGFPKDIAAKDFLEALQLYRQMWLESIEFSTARYRLLSGSVLDDEDYDAERAALATAVNIPENHLKKLSPTEKVVLSLMREGLPDKEIASKRGRSYGTIKKQVSAVIRKLKVENRTEAVVKTIPPGT